MYERTILGFVRVALGAEADHGGIFLVRDNAHDAVRGDGALVQHERDRLSNLDGIGVDLFDIDQRAGVIRRLHAAGQDAHRPQTDQPHTHQKQRQNDHQHHRSGGDGIAHFLNLF